MPYFVGSRGWPRVFGGAESSRRTLRLHSKLAAELAALQRRVIVR